MSSLNLAGVFTDALTEHLTIIRQLETQQDSFERAAILITDSLLHGHKVLGAETAAVPQTLSIWPRNWLGDFIIRALPWLP